MCPETMAPRVSGSNRLAADRRATLRVRPYKVRGIEPFGEAVKRRNTDSSSLRLAHAALSMPSLATLVYIIRDLPVAALQQSKNEGGARP